MELFNILRHPAMCNPGQQPCDKRVASPGCINTVDGITVEMNNAVAPQHHGTLLTVGHDFKLRGQSIESIKRMGKIVRACHPVAFFFREFKNVGLGGEMTHRLEHFMLIGPHLLP